MKMPSPGKHSFAILLICLNPPECLPQEAEPQVGVEVVPPDVVGLVVLREVKQVVHAVVPGRPLVVVGGQVGQPGGVGGQVKELDGGPVRLAEVHVAGYYYYFF